MEKLVSVVIPTYNRASMLKRAVESLLKQEHRNIEIIINYAPFRNGWGFIIGSR